MPLNVDDTNATYDREKPEPRPITHAPKADYATLKIIIIITMTLGVIATVIFFAVSSSYRDENSVPVPNSSNKQIIDEKSVQPQIERDTALSHDQVIDKVESPVRHEINRKKETAGRYTIIAGTYRIERNANKEVERLQNSGYESWLMAGDKYYRVALGRYDSELGARLSAERMKNLLRNGYMIKPIK